MPCHDGREDDISLQRIEHAQRVSDLIARNNQLARLLCEAGRARHNKTEVPNVVLQWWAQHCAQDAARGEPW